jgi:hypothetical protein
VSGLAGFVTGVDRLLARGHDLFPASGGAGNAGGNGPGGQPPPAPPGGGQLGAGATQAGDDYQQSQAAAASLSDDTSQAADDANTVSAQGRANAGGIRETARTQAAAIEPTTNQPAGVKLMVSTMDQRLSDMQRELDTANAQNRLIAMRMRQVAAAFQGIAPQMGAGGTGMPFSGFGSAGGGSGISGLSSLAGLPGTLMSPSGTSGHTAATPVASNQSAAPGAVAIVPGAHATKEQMKAYALSLFPEYGWGPEQMPALDTLWEHESNWNPSAHNASGASGIAQLMPYTNPYFSRGGGTGPWQTQIKEGLAYISDRYGNPAAAWGQYYNHPGGEGSY